MNATYDNNGNLTNDGTNGYSFDANNMVATVVTGSGTSTVTRDAFGRTVEVATSTGTYTEVLYGATGKIANMSGSSVQEIFAPLPGGAMAEASGSTYLVHHRDWLGTSRFISRLTARPLYFDAAYAPFGESYATSGTSDLEFTQERQDITSGLYDFQFREYIPNHGRWLSSDPSGLNAANPMYPQTWNRYAYVGNSPLTDSDFGGLMDWGAAGYEFGMDDMLWDTTDDTSEYADTTVPSDTSTSGTGDTSTQGDGSQTQALDGQLHVTKNADGTTSSYQGTTSTSKTTDSDGNTTTTTTTTVTTQTLNAHGDIVPNGTSTTTITSTQTVDSNGNLVKGSATTTETKIGLQDSNAQAQSMRSGSLSIMQMKLSDVVKMPFGIQPAFVDHFDVTPSDLWHGFIQFGVDASHQASYACAKAGIDCY
jgi:RHS repeat-associated protein